MASNEKDSVPEEFAKLCSVANYNPNNEVLVIRWNGVSACLQALKSEQVEPMLRVAFKFDHADKSVLEQLRAKFTETDPDFLSANNDREMEILCIAILMYGSAQGDPLGNVASLSLLTTSCSGARLPNSGDFDSISFSDALLRETAKEERKRNVIDGSAIRKKKADYDAAVAKSKANDHAGAFDAISELARAQFNATASTLEKVGDLFKIQDEELQVLWWLLNGWSRDLDRPLEGMPVGELALVAGKELADMSVTVIGVPAIKALLHRAGVSAKESFAVAEIVRAVGAEWLNMALKNIKPSPIFAPLHFAMSRSQEVGGKNSWVAPWADITRIDPSRKLPAVDWAHQFYRERMVLVNL